MKVAKLVGLTCLSIALSVGLLEAEHAQYYVLDGFGGVHAGNGAPTISPSTTYFGFDIAKGIVYIPDDTSGEGVVVLDGFGGIHVGGALAGSFTPDTTYFGFDIARAITYRNIPPRAAGGVNNSFTTLSTASGTCGAPGTFTTITSATMNAPDDGFILVVGSSKVLCDSSSGTVSGRVSISLDSTSADPDFSNGYQVNLDCAQPTASGFPSDNQAMSKLYSVSAGAHTVRFLALKCAGTEGFRLAGSTIAAVYVDQGFLGVSDAPPPVNEDWASLEGNK